MPSTSSPKVSNLVENALDQSLDEPTRRKLLITKVDLKINQGTAYVKTGNDSQGLVIFDEALEISRSRSLGVSGNQDAIAMIQNLKGLTLQSQNKHRSAISFFNEAVRIYGELNIVEGLSDSLYNLAVSSIAIDDLEAADTALKRCLDIRLGIKDKAKIADTYALLAQVEEHRNNPTEALRNFDEALKALAGSTDKVATARIYVQMGDINAKLGDYAKALLNYNSGLTGYKGASKNTEAADVENRIGEVYYAQRSYDTALTHFQTAQSGFSGTSDVETQRGWANATRNVGRAYQQKADYPKAMESYDKALSTFRSINDSLGTARTLNSRAADSGGAGQLHRGDRQSGRSPHHLPDWISRISAAPPRH